MKGMTPSSKCGSLLGGWGKYPDEFYFFRLMKTAPGPSVDDLMRPVYDLFENSPVDDSGLDRDSASGSSSAKSPGHQGEPNTGGKNSGLRVLFCSNMSITMDYEQVHLLMKPYGEIYRIRLCLDKSKSSFDCYIVFDNELSARKANEHFHGHSVNDNVLKTRIFHIENFRDDSHDFIPESILFTEAIVRNLSPPKWFVASYKKDKENLIKGMDCIKRRVGNIPDENIKRYGRAILIKAGNETQELLTFSFQTS